MAIFSGDYSTLAGFGVGAGFSYGGSGETQSVTVTIGQLDGDTLMQPIVDGALTAIAAVMTGASLSGVTYFCVGQPPAQAVAA